MGQNVRTIQYMSYQGFIYTCYLEIPGHIYWRGIEQATNNYLYQCWSTLLKQICVTRPRWVDSEWHIDVCVCVCAPNHARSSSVANLIVRRAGLLLSQQDFEWRWSVPLFQCLTVLEFSFILFDLCLLITFFNFIMNYVPIVTFWIFTYHKIWIYSIMFCFIWSYWIIYFLACL